MTHGRHFTLLLGVHLSGCAAERPLPSPADMGPDMAFHPIDCVAEPWCCIGCTSDSSCGVANPRCDLEPCGGQCVPCLPKDDNCGPGLICATINGSYSCVSTCTRSTDCIKLAGGGECCDGKCVDTMTDSAHCGDCGRSCPIYDHAASPCVGGVCAGCVCKPGFADCNKICADGCETDTTSDPKNCGACGRTCMPPANAIAACDPDGKGAGRCAFRCKPYARDCDGVAANGCEVDASSDPKNCGYCGNICPMNTPACVNSMCQA